MIAQKPEQSEAGRILRAVRKAERMAGDGHEIGGTGFTILKRQDSPISRMVAAQTIGPVEMRSAEDIATAFHSMAGGLLFRPIEMERRDRSNSHSEPARVIDAVKRYKKWADLWSIRAKRGDPTLEIIIAAVIDERPFREIDADLNLRKGRACRAVAAGLRDYAARAEWAQGDTKGWLVEQGSVFRLRRFRPIETLRSMAQRWDRVPVA